MIITPDRFLKSLISRCKRIFIVLFVAAVFALTSAVITRPASSAPPEPEITPTPLVNPRMEQPALPQNPTLADQGAQIYWLYCLACHGDQGQGLTDEYRKMAFGEDMNCWTSKCHGYNHPPEGFIFPRLVPPVVGEGTLKRFVTAAELQKYLYQKMPWWNPGLINKDEAWQLTAFLLRQNGNLSSEAEFKIKEAATIPVHLPIRSVRNEKLGQLLLIVSLGAVVLALITANRWKVLEHDESKQLPRTRPSFLHHLHPPTIPLPQARWRYTLGAGGIAVFLSLLLIITGILEMFFYIPTPEQAGASIQTITFLVPFGSLIRGIHFWAGQGLVIVAVVHLLRVVFTGAYSLPRRFNYLLGLFLFVLVLFLDFTGYVLRWDEGIRWALMVGTNLLKTIPLIGEAIYGFVIGGSQPGLATLTRFYTWHIFALTLILVIIVVWHIFRVRRDGGISAPPPEQRLDVRRISRFELVRREVIGMLVVCTVVLLLGALIPAPLAVPIQENVVTPFSEVRAPWFFLWVQYLLRYGDAFWMGVAIPLGILLLLAVLPYLLPGLPAEQKGHWFPRAGRAAQIVIAGLTLAVLILTILELFQ
jgi:quinol-cytochrome oxidoreductase complex cytochrome b subunit